MMYVSMHVLIYSVCKRAIVSTGFICMGDERHDVSLACNDLTFVKTDSLPSCVCFDSNR